MGKLHRFPIRESWSPSSGPAFSTSTFTKVTWVSSGYCDSEPNQAKAASSIRHNKASGERFMSRSLTDGMWNEDSGKDVLESGKIDRILRRFRNNESRIIFEQSANIS